MRKFLVTKFACAKCNSNLQIADRPMPKWAPHEDGEPTGCEMHENVILLEPCQKCMQPLVRDDVLQREAKQSSAHGQFTPPYPA